MKHIIGWSKLHAGGIILFSFVILLTLVLGRNLNLNSRQMFTFHDETQAARVQQFTRNLQELQIPPRMAPEFSYGMGYPVFNFYAPFAYWVTSGLSLLGLSTIASLKLSFLLALLVGFLGMYMLLKELFDDMSGLFGGVLYVTSTFIPVEIFVRGNLSEMWFIALFPVTLYLLVKNSTSNSKVIFIVTAVALSFLFSVHNVFSLLSIGLVLVFIGLLGGKKKNFLTFVLGGLLASYFIVPALLESGLTYASTVATKTSFADNFLCIKQLWLGQWGFGGSVPGCDFDGMSFALGKTQIVFGLLGGVLLLVKIVRAKTWKALESSSRIVLAVGIMTVTSLFLTLYQSQLIWNIFAPLLSLFQFPWRFLVFGVFGLAVLGAYAVHPILIGKDTAFAKIIVCIMSVILVFSVTDLFKGQSMSNTLYESKYLSDDYIHNNVAYKIPEYLPKSASYDIWRSFEDKNTVPYSEGLFEKNNLNIHYFPNWHISIDGREIVPTEFDSLGRPKLAVEDTSIIKVSYRQTPIEQTGNVLSIGALLLLFALVYKPIWMKIQKTKN